MLPAIQVLSKKIQRRLGEVEQASKQVSLKVSHELQSFVDTQRTLSNTLVKIHTELEAKLKEASQVRFFSVHL